MGLYDRLRCDLELTKRPEWMTEFQTKDTPEQYLGLYLIAEDRMLYHREGEEWVTVPFDGAIDFYSSNWASICDGCILLAEGTGTEYISCEYHCVFVDGVLVKGPELSKFTADSGPNVYTDRMIYEYEVRTKRKSMLREEP